MALINYQFPSSQKGKACCGEGNQHVEETIPCNSKGNACHSRSRIILVCALLHKTWNETNTQLLLEDDHEHDQPPEEENI